MKNYLSLLAIPILFLTACASDSLPAEELESAVTIGVPPSTPRQVTPWEPIVYEVPPVPIPVASRIISCDFMPHPVCRIPAPLAPVTIGCDLRRPPEPTPMITCAEPPYVPHPDVDTGSTN